ncbi:MAG TPA: hypothetical protein VL860_15345, partial [Planctomycetota bacterium]|nr:hypothetical protein [Planctomycetota bacterium]
MAKPGGEIIFVGGTDTGVGKSLFTAAFTVLDRRGAGRGGRTGAGPRDAAGFKGAASDCVEVNLAGNPVRLNEDILLLAIANQWPLGETAWRPELDLAGLAPAVEEVAPLRYLMPAAPTVAARTERRFVDTTGMTRALENLAERRGRVYYEGIGGLMVPLDDSTVSIDHARRLC